jgi:hypothetical protein
MNTAAVAETWHILSIHQIIIYVDLLTLIVCPYNKIYKLTDFSLWGY